MAAFTQLAPEATDPAAGAGAPGTPLPPDDHGIARKVRRGLLLAAANNLTLRLGNVAVGILLARLLTPEEFGVFAVGLTVQAVLVTLADLGLGAELIRTGEIRRRGPTITTLAFGVSVTLAAVMIAFAGPIAASLGSADAAGVVRVLAGTILLSGVSVVPYAVLQRNFAQGRAFQADASGLVSSTAVVVALVALGLGPMALAWSRVAGQLVAVSLLFVFARQVPRFGWDWALARHSARLGAPLAVANLLSWALLSVDYVVVGRTLGPVELGLYVLAFNMSAWPITAIGQAIRNVALPGFARQDQDRATMTRSLELGISLTWGLGALAGAMLSVLAHPLILSVYGDRWAGAATALVGLGCFGAVRLVTDLLTTFLVSQAANRAVMIIQVLWLVALVPALVLGTRAYGIAGTGFAHLVVVLFVVLPAYLVAVSRTGVPAARLLRACIVPALAVLPAAAAAWGAARWFPGPWLQLVAGGLAGVAVYALLVLRWLRSRLAESRTGSGVAGPVQPPGADAGTAAGTGIDHLGGHRPGAAPTPTGEHPAPPDHDRLRLAPAGIDALQHAPPLTDQDDWGRPPGRHALPGPPRDAVPRAGAANGTGRRGRHARTDTTERISP